MSELEIVKAVVTGNPVDLVVSVVDAARQRTPDARLDKAFQDQVNDIVLQLAKEWDEEKNKAKQRPLKEDVEKGLFRLADAYHEARNNKKRRMLYTAFYSYFRPEFYDEGISEILWEKVERLEYPDLWFLYRMLRTLEAVSRRPPTSSSKDIRAEEVNGEFVPFRIHEGHKIELQLSDPDVEYAERLGREGLAVLENGTKLRVFVVPKGLAEKMKDFALKEFWNEPVRVTKPGTEEDSAHQALDHQGQPERPQ